MSYQHLKKQIWNIYILWYTMKYIIHDTKQHDMSEVLRRRLYKRQMQFVILLSNVKEKIRIHNLIDIRTGVSYLLFLFLFYIEVYLIILWRAEIYFEISCK